MRHTFKLILAILPLLAACEETIDFAVDSKGRIYIDATLHEGGENRITVNVSTPLNGHEIATADDVQIVLESDGVPLTLERDADYRSSHGEISYLIQEELHTGQSFDLRAEANGLESVKASATIPEPLPEIDFTHSLVETYKASNPYEVMSLNTLEEFKINIHEMPSDDKYYGVQMLRKLEYITVGDVPSYVWKKYADKREVVEYDKFYVTGMMYGADLSLTDTEIRHKLYGGDLMVGQKCVYIKPGESGLIEGKYIIVDGVEQIDFEVRRTCRYKLKVYRLSPQTYKCIKSRYIAEYSDAPLHLGFSPATYVYTNIEGGLGMFGAVSCYESDWFDLVHRLQ